MTIETREFPLRHVLAVYTRLKLLEWGEEAGRWFELVDWMAGGDLTSLNPYEVFSAVRGQLLKQFPWLKQLESYQGEIRNGESMISARTWALVDKLEERHGRVVPVMPIPPENRPQPSALTVTYVGEVEIELDPSKGDLPTRFLRQIRDAIADQLRREFGESGGENPW